MTPPSTSIGVGLRAAAALGRENNEDSMYPGLQAALSMLLPRGHRVVVRARGTGADKPDMSLTTADGAIVAHIEVKHAATLHQAFRPDGSGVHQIGRYRGDHVPVLLTDAIRWFDVTDSDDTTRPAATFADDDLTSDSASEAQLRSLLHTICGVRPRYVLDSAVAGVSGVIARVNAAEDEPLTRGWEVVRDGLGLSIDANSLDGSGVGEIVAFTLLSIATSLPPLDDKLFVSAARAEWTTASARWNAESLPTTMNWTLRLFRDEDRSLGGLLLGADGWVTIRSIAAWLAGGSRVDEWARLSDLWDAYLHRQGRRKTLGSWQTPRPVADYQAAQVAEALRALGYQGLHDPSVTIIDPCCGTGVYLDAVVSQAIADGGSPGGFNASTRGGAPRLLGADISSTAIAAAHIRASASGARPSLHMTDTLATGAASSLLTLFDAMGSAAANPIVAAAAADYHEMQAWASRDQGRGPVLAVVGNPPYLRAALAGSSRYSQLDWYTTALAEWRRGSGGRGVLDDLYIGFWAWAITLCRRPHPELAEPPPFGVVSFITNRAWTRDQSFRPMRRWVEGLAARIEVTDFGPASRRGASERWSEQPFQIETGTAIVTLTFGSERVPVTYHKAHWSPSGITILESDEVNREEWVTGLQHPSLTADIPTFSGVVTGEDGRWTAVDADRVMATRYAYRPFDNRWVPHTPPRRAPRSRLPLPDEARPSSYWRLDDLWGATRAEHARQGGWYALFPSPASVPAPGPAIHATRHVMDMHSFGGDGGIVVAVGPATRIPAGLYRGDNVYRDWAEGLGLSPRDFWLYVLAAGHHLDYWTAGTPMAAQLASVQITPPLTDRRDVADALIVLGEELVGLWSLDDVVEARVRSADDGWEVEGEEEALAILVHGRPVLARWRDARPEPWDRLRAREYARSVAALLRVHSIAQEVATLLA